MTMLLTIPSSKRADRQITLRNLRKLKVRDPIAICVPEDQEQRYRLNLPDVKIVGVPSTHGGISKTREWILTELARREKQRYVAMIDDDMEFCYRPDVKDAKLLMVDTPERAADMLGRLEGWMRKDRFVHVGVSARQGNNNESRDENGVYGLHVYRDATRMMNFYAYDTEKLGELVKAGKLKLGRIPVMEDFDLTLQLLRLGYPNRVLYEYCWNQRDSGATGGCSSYRTPEMQASAAHRLAELHPGLVKVVTKRSKETSGSWKGMKERTDVTVYWRKAIDLTQVTR